jgi:hypothetical protein
MNLWVTVAFELIPKWFRLQTTTCDGVRVLPAQLGGLQGLQLDPCGVGVGDLVDRAHMRRSTREDDTAPSSNLGRASTCTRVSYHPPLSPTGSTIIPAS